jgi:hypothetical protein
VVRVVLRKPFHHAPSRAAVGDNTRIGRPASNQSTKRKACAGTHGRTRTEARPSDTASFSPAYFTLPPRRSMSAGKNSEFLAAELLGVTARRQQIEGASHGGERKTTARLAAPHAARFSLPPSSLSRSMPSKSLADLLFFQHQPGSDLRLRCFCLLTCALINESVR